MQSNCLIEKIKLRNILSFGDKREEIALKSLNIIIGQNASGKSNLIDIIKLLRSLTLDNGLINFISKNGGISEWIWKGQSALRDAEIEIVANRPHSKIGYELTFIEYYQRLMVKKESFKYDNDNYTFEEDASGFHLPLFDRPIHFDNKN